VRPGPSPSQREPGVSEVRDFDQRQQLESYHAGVADTFATHTLADWLAARLDGHGSYLGVTTYAFYQERSQVEVD
jgi:hypothetical protein